VVFHWQEAISCQEVNISRLFKLTRNLLKKSNIKAANVSGLMESFSNLLASYDNVDLARRISPVDAFFVYRVLLGRNPHRKRDLPGILNTTLTYREFLDSIIQSELFRKQPGFLPPDRIWLAEVERFRFWFNTSDREMGVKMAIGKYETRCVDLIKQIIKPGMKCIDAGAHTGFYTCLLASLVRPAGRVYAFEPAPSNFALLKRNIDENHYGDCVELHHVACSDAPKTLQGSFVSRMYVSGEIGGAEKISVAAVRVDDVVDGMIDFIKIDVEGHEPFAVRGMISIISKCHPVILSEINEYWLNECSGTSGKEYLDLLISLGYQVYNVKATGRPLDPKEFRADILDNIEIVAFPKDQSNRAVVV
jgi:FkbM family methyltransferase